MENIEKAERPEKRLKEVILHFRQYTTVVRRKEGKQELDFVLKNNGGYTVLVRKEGEEYITTMARCGKKDNFNRTVGLAIVRGRAECTRRELSIKAPFNLTLHELCKLNHKTREKYSRDFLELLLKKLV